MINRLIDRYMNGLTSPEEQRRLHRLLMADDLPEEYLPYREMFTLLGEPMEVPSDKELKDFAQANQLEVAETEGGRIIPLRPWLRYAGIAASLVLVFLAGRWSVGENPRVIVHELPETDLAQYNDLFNTEKGTTIEDAFDACEEDMTDFEYHYINSNPHEEL
ncbi:MAG: hypothetical protein IJX44_06195 [Bacteroidaceae bacterium]|nr:hypothetical protein [Bacteroidaceae bacterium]